MAEEPEVVDLTRHPWVASAKQGMIPQPTPAQYRFDVVQLQDPDGNPVPAIMLTINDVTGIKNTYFDPATWEQFCAGAMQAYSEASKSMAARLTVVRPDQLDGFLKSAKPFMDGSKT